MDADYHKTALEIAETAVELAEADARERAKRAFGQNRCNDYAEVFEDENGEPYNHECKHLRRFLTEYDNE